MKKNTILKVLSFVLLLTFVFSAVLLTGCGKQEDAAKQTDLEATNEDLKAAKNEIAKLQTAIENLQEASAASEALSQKVAALEAALEAVSGDSEAIQELVAEIEAASEALDAAKEELGAAVQEATEALESLDDIYATDEALTAEINALKNGVIKDLQTAVAALEGATGADEDLSELVAIINDRLVKSDWIAATDVLFDDSNPRSIAAFKKGIVRVGDTAAMPYEDADIKAYEAQADLLADKLLRAISLNDIDDTFALRDQLFAALTPIVEKFDAELTRLEPDKDENGEVIPGTGKLYFPAAYIANFYGNNPEEKDQLARLDDLKDLIDERELFPTETEEETAYKKAQEARYDAIHEAQDRLAAAETDDNLIYAHQVEFGLGKDATVYLKDATKANLDTIKGEYDEQVAPQFDSEKVDTTYYAVGMKNLPGYVNYLNKLARYNALLDAKAEFEAKYPELTYFQDYNINDPMLDAYDGIETIDGAWLDSWKAKWKLEDIRTITVDEEQVEKDFELENCFIIIDSVDQTLSEGQEGGTRLGGYGRVLAIRYYVQTLHDLKVKYVDPFVKKDDHEDIVTKNLVGQIKTEVELGANKVLWAHVPTLDDIFAKIDAIDAAINGLKFELNEEYAQVSYTYSPKEACKNAMIGLDGTKNINNRKVLADIRTRVETLKATMADLIKLGNELLAKYYVDGQWEVSLRDSNYIKIELQKTVDNYFIDRSIFTTDEDEETNAENYDVMTEYFRFNIQPYLNAALDNITEILKTIYGDVKDVVYKEETYLPDLNKLIIAQSEVFKVMAGCTVDETDFVLDEVNAVKFSEFFNALLVKVVRVVDLAEAAEIESATLNQLIEGLGKDFDLNKTFAVDTVSDAAVLGFEKYLGVKFADFIPEDENAEIDNPAIVSAYLEAVAQYFVNTKVEDKTLTYPVYIVDDEGAIIADYDHPYTRTIKTVTNDGILNIYKYNNETISSEDVYDFVSGDNFTALKELQATRVAVYNAAKEAWAKVNMTPDANRADIDASFVAFTEYVQEYYTNIRELEDEWASIEEYYELVGEEQFHFNGDVKIIDKTAEEDLADKIIEKMETETVTEKAARYASYIVGSEHGQEEYVGEFDELIAYRSLCNRSNQYDAIMALAVKLDDVTVPADVDGFEADVLGLKEMISAFRSDFEYNGKIYNDAITAANGEITNADLVAYVGAAKVYVVNAFEKAESGSYPYLYVRDVITANGKSYNLPEDEATVLTTYCVEMIQKVCVNAEQVDAAIRVFRLQALLSNAYDPDFNDDDMYPEFDYESEFHFVENNEGL
ncbi:MAG: hypothetical protein E7680_04325 [Ruminococcaceae bacterium]|nr:hypothetical protein [Oscillospiraceae bacterium]